MASDNSLQNRIVELFWIILREEPESTLHDWVWECLKVIKREALPKEFPGFCERNADLFYFGLISGILLSTVDILKNPADARYELTVKTSLACGPESYQSKMIHWLGRPDELASKMAGVLHKRVVSESAEGRTMFARGQLAGTEFENLVDRFRRASGTTFTLSLILWQNWPDVATAKDVPSVYRALEEEFRAANLTLSEPEAFKQFAHRIGLSRYLAEKNRTHAVSDIDRKSMSLT